MTNWHPASWQDKPRDLQSIEYPSPDAAMAVVNQLAALPPLVTPMEVERLRLQLAEASRGERFILQGGDCAESFADCRSEIITNKLKILLQMSLILLQGLRVPITRVGRIAGQYAKPRSAPMETIDGLTLPSYRGDLINDAPFNKVSRTPDPERMLVAYRNAGLTLNYIRTLVSSGFADLHHPEYWKLDFVKHSPLEKEYRNTANDIANALDFIKLIPGANAAIELNRVEFYTAHEALHLPYEQPLTRQDEKGQWYNLSTHYPWIGKRTAYSGSPHLEYMRGIKNPIGVKLGPDTQAQELIDLVHTLNPDNEAGRLTLIHRMGAKQIKDALPPLIETVQQNNFAVMWSCDPMHGNTETTANGTKTRKFENILDELKQAFNIHKEMDSVLGGVHFELSGEDVTECTGGARDLVEEDLKRAYTSLVDPRLNYEQALEMAMLIVRKT